MPDHPVVLEDATDTDELRLLCVDDEPRVLEGLENHLAFDYDVFVSTRPTEALEILEREGPFAAVISDMRMPTMDGATFLAHVRERAPDATRLLLTGQADLTAAVAAVNEGGIFRFLTKPCPTPQLLSAVADSVRQYRLVTAERELLERTLNGVVTVLTEVMSLTAPAAFSRTKVLTHYVRHLCRAEGIADTWAFELAATLAMLGCITLPGDTLDRRYAGQPLEDAETEMFRRHPEIGARLLEKIPRLGEVACMIRGQLRPPPRTRPAHEDPATFGSQLVAIALAFDREILAGYAPTRAVDRLLRHASPLDRGLVERLRTVKVPSTTGTVRAVMVSELRAFMVLEEDVVSSVGNTIVPKGRELHGPLLEKLQNFAQGIGVVEPIRVRVPA